MYNKFLASNYSQNTNLLSTPFVSTIMSKSHLNQIATKEEAYNRALWQFKIIIKLISIKYI